MGLDKILQEFEKIRTSSESLPDKASKAKGYYRIADPKGKYEIRARLIQYLGSHKKSDELFGLYVGGVIGLENVWAKAMENLSNYDLAVRDASINISALTELNHFPEKTAEAIRNWIPNLPHQALVSISKMNYDLALKEYAANQESLDDKFDTLSLMFENRIQKIGSEEFLKEQAGYDSKYAIDKTVVNHAAKDALRRNLKIKY